MASRQKSGPQVSADPAAAHLKAGRWLQAIAVLRKQIERAPLQADLRFNLAYALKENGAPRDALTAYLATVALDPRSVRGHNNLGNLLLELGEREAAAEHFRTVVSLNPDHANANKMLGMILTKSGAPADAVPFLEQCVAAMPTAKEPQFLLAEAMTALHQLDRAADIYQTLIDDEPDGWDARNNLASILQQTGRVDEGLIEWRVARENAPTNPVLQSNIILATHYTPTETPSYRQAELRLWAERNEAPLMAGWPRHGNDRQPDRPLRIGYVSSDFRRHPIGFFMLGVFAMHDREEFAVYAYSATTREDAMTAELKKHVPAWRDVAGMGPAAIADIVQKDEIDILIDLAGHSAGNQLLVLARKPAPVQFIAGGHCGSSGLRAVDYAISDLYQSPPGTEGEFTESVVRLKSGYVCYAPPTYAPDVTPLPALETGYVTFGCLNNTAKVGPEVVERWSEILVALPDARLFLANRGFADEGTCARYREDFSRYGVDPERINFAGVALHTTYLGYYGQIDIALDPFPYSGGLTTCEAMWMGVPVLTMAGGNSFVSRHSVGHLSRAGLDAFIAATAESYVAMAVNLAGDLPSLAELRTNLRQRVLNSPLCDCRGHTGELEAAYRRAWRRWCDGEPGSKMPQ